MTAAPDADGAPANPSKIRITMWQTDTVLWATSGADVALEAAEEFNQMHPEYQVVVERRDFRTMPAEMVAAAEQGEAPDISEYHHTVTCHALDMVRPDGTPLFIPVERAVAGRSEILGHPVVFDDMLPAVRDFFRVDGELTCVPRTHSTVVLYANLDILARAGITELPRTWREVTAACRAIGELPDGPGHAITWPNTYLLFLQTLAQQGGLLSDHDDGRSGRAEKLDLASAEMLAFANYWQQLHQDGAYLYTGQPIDFDGGFRAFEEQRVAILITSSVDAAHLFARGERQGFRVAVGRMPYNDQVPRRGNMTGGFSMWLTAGLDPVKQDGALAFMQYLVSPRHGAHWARHHHRIPITRAAVEVLEREGFYAAHPDLRVGYDQLEDSDGSPAALGPLLGAHAGIVGELTATMHDVMTAGAEPATRLVEANERAQQLLDAYHARVDGPPRRTPVDLVVSI